MTILLSLLPFFTFISLFLFWFSHFDKRESLGKIRVALMYAMLSCATFIIFITEVLSRVHAINRASLVMVWTILLAVITILNYKKGVRLHILREGYHKLFKVLRKRPVAGIIPVILLISFIVALIYPPNNYDSMTYHMARVGYWIQNQSISYYPTHILRQLIFPPLSEWILLHVQVLAGRDVFANSVQTFFFGMCILQVSLITKLLGGNSLKQLLAALFTCLIPMAIIQSNTTQNDIVVSYFLLVFVYFMIRVVQTNSMWNIVFAGIALGLALFTKGIAYLFFIFLGWFVFVLLKRPLPPVKQLILKSATLAIVPIVALLFNIGVFYRNYELNGSFLGKGNKGVANEAHQFKPLVLVAVKNFMNLMPVTSTMKAQLAFISAKEGVDVNDHRYNYQTMDQMMSGFSYHEDYAQNFFHAIYVIIFAFVFLARNRLYKNPPDMFVLFSVTLYLLLIAFCVLFKWQPWGNRLETSLFMLFCVMFGMLLGDFPRFWRILFFLPLLYTGGKSLLYSGNHPILPWEKNVLNTGYDSYIYNKPEYQEEKKFFDTTSIRTFGLHIGADSWDYPYYKMISESENKNKLSIHHIYVSNESKKYDTGYVPEAFLTYQVDRVSDTLGGKKYIRTRIFGNRRALLEVVR